MTIYIGREASKVIFFVYSLRFEFKINWVLLYGVFVIVVLDFILTLFYASDVKLWKRICAETTTEINLLLENWKYILACLIFQVSFTSEKFLMQYHCVILFSTYKVKVIEFIFLFYDSVGSRVHPKIINFWLCVMLEFLVKLDCDLNGILTWFNLQGKQWNLI